MLSKILSKKKSLPVDYEPLPIISKDFPNVAIRLIESAKRSISIVVFDWRFYKSDIKNVVNDFNFAIERACVRGVDVKCLVQNDGIVDILKKMGCNARKLHSKRILHTKLLIVDDSRIILGSHNYTQSAFTSNYEASIFVNLGSSKNAFVEYFNNLFGL